MPSKCWKFRKKCTGWGLIKDSNEIDGIPREVDMPIYGIWKCIIKNPTIAQLASKRTFCAGGDGKGPCKGLADIILFNIFWNDFKQLFIFIPI